MLFFKFDDPEGFTELADLSFCKMPALVLLNLGVW